jgi:hypothetical protein
VVTPVTGTENWHWSFSAIPAPASEIWFGAVVVRVPPHSGIDWLATLSPDGSVSSKATPLAGSGLLEGLASVKVSGVL